MHRFQNWWSELISMKKTARVLIKDLPSQNLRQFFAIAKAGFGRIWFLALVVCRRKFSTLTKLEATQTLLEKNIFSWEQKLHTWWLQTVESIIHCFVCWGVSTILFCLQKEVFTWIRDGGWALKLPVWMHRKQMGEWYSIWKLAQQGRS